MKQRKDKQPIWLENRPNRNVASIDQMKDNGFDTSDNGSFQRQLENQIDLDIFIDHLTPKQQKIANMLLDGYKQVEIAKELNIVKSAVSNIKKRIERELLA